MATKKDAGATARYRVLRDFGGNVAGDILNLDQDNAADLVRDGMIEPADTPAEG